MKTLEEIIAKIEAEIQQYNFGSNPKELYEPIDYIMSLGGKRLRPALAIMAYQMFAEPEDFVYKSSLAIEVFHNFSLVHDDIMDEAPLRRGKDTVHKKWNDNIAILSGDVMLVKAYELLLNTPSEYLKSAIDKFNVCATEVCEGQQMDMNFEGRDNVHEDEYLEMIKLKTAVLLGYSLELGAMMAGASEDDCALLKKFGIDIGIGFQLKDDYLDVYGDPEKFGKQVGGDILCDKKTYLLIKAFENANAEQKEELNQWINQPGVDETQKVQRVTELYEEIGAKELTKTLMKTYFDEALNSLDKVSVSDEKKQLIKNFALYLIERDK